jgi:hypothetical protein
LGTTVQNAGELAASTPAAPATTFGGQLVMTRGAAGNYSTTQTNSVQFASAVSHNFSPAGAFGLRNLFKNTTAPAKAVLVLTNFEVQQNGDAIRIVDADGSIYDGSLQPESVVAQTIMPPGATLAPRVNAPARVGQEKAIANRNELQTAQNYYFRVTGMNRTLKQNVMFAGNLLVNSDTTTNLQQSFGGSGGIGGGGGGGFAGGRLQSALANQLPWSNSRIAGTAVIADTNEIEINAVPVSP